MTMQLMSIESEIQDSIATNSNRVCHITYNRDSWVKLYHSPNSYSEKEAILLCEKSSGIWVSWIPEYGEIILNKSDFYC
ncbi:hypothetical protein [Geminocystis sp.]|uniref:hypothetical protein n=1 Tax=Geminocystis sp. TaxID=2664100 RepID=UPI003593A37C